MPIIEGVGDEVVYVAVFAASVVLIFRPSLRHCSVSLGKLGVNLTRKCFQRIWNGVRALSSSNNMDSSRATSTEQEGFLMRMDSPPENDCCSVCHDNFDLPCQANCAHWFCGDCILRVWHHSSALQPCKCPICRRPINLLIPCDSASQRRNEPEVDSVLQNIEKYNRIFGGGSVGFFQRLWDTPLLLRRLLRELMDPQRALPLVFRARIVCFLALLAVYVFSPVDILPEGILGIVGLLDDLLRIQNNKMGKEWTLCIQVKYYPNLGHSTIEYVLRNNVLNEVIHRKKRNTWNNNEQRGLLHYPYIRAKNCQNVQIQWHICLHQF